jgi:hypothetical protein
MRIISLKSGKLNRMAECNSAFMQELLARPGRAGGLPVSRDGNEHHRVVS